MRERPRRFFHFYLARALGMSVEHMLNTFSAAEIAEWRAFLRLEKKLHEEAAVDRELEDVAVRGSEEIRNKFRGIG